MNKELVLEAFEVYKNNHTESRNEQLESYINRFTKKEGELFYKMMTDHLFEILNKK
jgi:hypothetical protein